jgi:hypothetical protein
MACAPHRERDATAENPLASRHVIQRKAHARVGGLLWTVLCVGSQVFVAELSGHRLYP